MRGHWKKQPVQQKSSPTHGNVEKPAQQPRPSTAKKKKKTWLLNTKILSFWYREPWDKKSARVQVRKRKGRVCWESYNAKKWTQKCPVSLFLVFTSPLGAPLIIKAIPFYQVYNSDRAMARVVTWMKQHSSLQLVQPNAFWWSDAAAHKTRH